MPQEHPIFLDKTISQNQGTQKRCAGRGCLCGFFCETDHSNGAWHISSGWQYVLEVRVGVGTC